MLRSCSKQLKLLGDRGTPKAGILRLLFAHHVDHLDPTQDRTGAGDRLKAEHWPHSPLNSAMILFNAVIAVGTLPDPDRPQFAS